MSTNSDDDTSATLIMRIQKDPADQQAWDEFVQRYRPMIHAWCLRSGAQPSDADDIAQEVLIKLLAAIKKRHGADAAKELRMPVAHVFVARYRVQRMLEEEVRFLKESPCRPAAP